MAKYKNKYRIESHRLNGYDYGSSAIYFITICTKNRKHYFGNVVDGKMILSAIGRVVEGEWQKTFEMRPDMNLLMGEWIIMPNHFHAIIIIGENEFNSNNAANTNTPSTDAMHCVSTESKEGESTESKSEKEPYQNKFGPQSKNLASIIRGFNPHCSYVEVTI
jgi:REP element-mobilizing transposase RayT